MLTLAAVTLAIAPTFAYVPPPAARLIERHLQRIENNGWAHPVPGDLYHAHLLLPPWAPATFRSLDELFGATTMILYHADEMLTRWRLDDGDLPAAQRRPRSIIGYPDGRVAAAVSLLPDPSAAVDYPFGGTVHSDDLAHQLPLQVAERSDREIRTPRGTCIVNLIVDISPSHPPEPTIAVGGARLKLTMDCVR